MTNRNKEALAKLEKIDRSIETKKINSLISELYGLSELIDQHFVLVTTGIKKANFRIKTDTMPAITLSGQWLETVGFHPGTFCEAVRMYRRLVLIPAEEDGPSNVTAAKSKLVKVPKIYLEGEWLYTVGCKAGHFVKVDVYTTTLVIEPINNFISNKLSYSRWLEKHDKIGLDHFPAYYNSLTSDEKNNL